MRVVCVHVKREREVGLKKEQFLFLYCHVFI